MPRRNFLSAGLRAAPGLAILSRLNRAYAAAAPEELAGEEPFWEQIRLAYDRAPGILNFNNGGVAPAPNSVLDEQIRLTRLANRAPAYELWTVLEPQLEAVRKRLAKTWAVDAEEIAITRNATESLEAAELGLELKPGDEVLITNQDYPRMINTWRQRQRRDGIVLKQLSLQVPVRRPEDVVETYRRAITPRTRVLHCCHVINLTGEILPVARLTALARQHGLISIVDGAHAIAHFPFTLAELGCDYYGASLHKWLSAPIGTGVLYVRRPLIEKTWPLFGEWPGEDKNIRKFEEIGTHPAAPHNAILQALDFYDALGYERKAARLQYLKMRWARRLLRQPGARLLAQPGRGHSCGVATIDFPGVDPAWLQDQLWKQDRILVQEITHPEFKGTRVTPNVYNTPAEADRFSAAMERLLAQWPHRKPAAAGSHAG